MKRPYQVGLSLGVIIGLLVIGYVLLEFAPSPWKQWGGMIVLVLISSQMVVRASQEIFGNFDMKWLPYVIATFIPTVLVILFAPIPYSAIAFIILFSIAGIVTYYWIVAIIMSSAKDFWRDVLRRGNGTPQSK